MSEYSSFQKKLTIAAYLQREDNRIHHGYDEELLQYIYVMNGDPRVIEISKKMFRGNRNGKLSNDPIRQFKYLFVASTTLTTRYAIRGGMEPQDAYNLSDLFIQRVDLCMSIDEVCSLQTEMIQNFTEQVASIKAKKNQLSSNNLYVKQLEDYIYLHLHEKIRVEELANEVGLTPNYLSSLFKKETGRSIQQYITNKKIEVASNMLLYSEYSLTDIGNILAFSSTSHFIKTFKSIMEQTPRQYKLHIYDNNFISPLPSDSPTS